MGGLGLPAREPRGLPALGDGRDRLALLYLALSLISPPVASPSLPDPAALARFLLVFADAACVSFALFDSTLRLDRGTGVARVLFPSGTDVGGAGDDAREAGAGVEVAVG